MASRILSYVLLFVVGVIVGTVGTVAQQSTTTLLGVSFPWGEILGLIAVASLLVGLRLVNEGRWQAFTAAVGVVIPVAIFTLPSQGGSVLIPGNGLGYAWIYGTVIIAIIVIAWPEPRARRDVAENRIS
jgi:hypothetical protein